MGLAQHTALPPARPSRLLLRLASSGAAKAAMRLSRSQSVPHRFFPRLDAEMVVDALPLLIPFHGNVVLEEGIKVAYRPLQPVGYHAQRRLRLEVGEVRLDVEPRGG